MSKRLDKCPDCGMTWPKRPFGNAYWEHRKHCKGKVVKP